jgi:glutathione peroxidase-family protein
VQRITHFIGRRRGLLSTTPSTTPHKTKQDIDGKTVPMSSFKGKAVLVVNTASACGFTPQYAELQEIYDKYKAKGLVVAAWPCNQFGKQEPGSNAQIKSFAKSTYSVTFPLFSKVRGSVCPTRLFARAPAGPLAPG